MFRLPLLSMAGRAGLHGGGPEVSVWECPQAHGLGFFQLGYP